MPSQPREPIVSLVEGSTVQMEPPAQPGKLAANLAFFEMPPSLVEDPGGQHLLRLMPPSKSDFYFHLPPRLAPVTKTMGESLADSTPGDAGGGETLAGSFVLPQGFQFSFLRQPTEKG